MNQAQSLPLCVGGGLVDIKTLLSRDPCAHANTAIQMIDAILAGTAPLAQQEPELVAGCVCRWNSEGDRVVTCERHQGWLEVIAEWADRAREAEKKLKFLMNTSPPAQPQPEPVAWIPIITWRWNNNAGTWEGLTNTPPPARKPLTKSQVLDLWEQTYVQRGTTGIEFARAVEAAHGIKEQP